MIDIVIVQTLITAILGLFKLPTGVTNFVSSLTNQLPALVAAGTDIQMFVKNQMVVIRKMIAEKRDPTEEEWATLNATMSAELEKLNIQGMNPAAPGSS